MVLCPEKMVPPLGLIAGMVSVLQPLARMQTYAKTPQASDGSMPTHKLGFAIALEDRSGASILQDHMGQQEEERFEAHCAS